MTPRKFSVLTFPAGHAAGADEHGGDDAADPAAAPTFAAVATARTEDRRALGEQGRMARSYVQAEYRGRLKNWPQVW